MKNLFSYTFLLLLSIIAVSCKNNQAPSPGNWETGSSINLFSHGSQEVFSEFKNNGFHFLELSSAIFLENSYEERVLYCNRMKKMIDYSGMETWSVHLPFGSIYDISSIDKEARDRAVSELTEVINFGKMFGPKKYVIHGSPEVENENERAARIENCIASLKVLNEEVKKQGAQLAVECLKSTCLGNTSTELVHMVNSVGNGIGICFDSNHLMQEKPEEFVEKAGNLICTVHISDYDGKKSWHWLPGRGNINWGNVVSALLKTGYPGPFMFEVKNIFDEPAVYAKELAKSWELIKNEYKKSTSK